MRYQAALHPDTFAFIFRPAPGAGFVLFIPPVAVHAFAPERLVGDVAFDVGGFAFRAGHFLFAHF